MDSEFGQFYPNMFSNGFSMDFPTTILGYLPPEIWISEVLDCVFDSGLRDVELHGMGPLGTEEGRWGSPNMGMDFDSNNGI